MDVHCTFRVSLQLPHKMMILPRIISSWTIFKRKKWMNEWLNWFSTVSSTAKVFLRILFGCMTSSNPRASFSLLKNTWKMHVDCTQCACIFVELSLLCCFSVDGEWNLMSSRQFGNGFYNFGINILIFGWRFFYIQMKLHFEV